MDLKELYKDIILEHGKSPRNFGKCEKHTHEAKGQLHLHHSYSCNMQYDYQLLYEP